MKGNNKTKKQLLLEMKELRTRLDTAEWSLKEAKEELQVKNTEHKGAEEALEKTKQYAQSIVETIREPLVVLTADLKVISANHSFYQTFKVAPEETEGRFIYSIGKRQWDIPVLRELLEEIIPKNSRFNDFKVDHEFPAIGRRTMLLNARRIYREGKGTEMILLAIEDTTEHTRGEEALKISETRYRRLFETAQDGILILDADTGQISDVNPFLVEMLGYSNADVLGKKLWEIGAFKDIGASKAAFSELQRKGYVRYEDLPLETRGGRHIDVEFVSNVYLVDHKKVIQCNIRDITERKKAEEKLRAREERYRSYIEVTGQLAWTTNTDGEVVEDIPVWRKFTGQSEEETKGAGWAKALHPDDVKHAMEAWNKAVATKTGYEVEYRIRRYDGAYRHFLARGVPVFKDDGNIREWVGTCIDITERKRSEEALKKAHDELEQRVKERTAQLMRANEQLIQEMEEHKRDEEEKVRQHRRLEGLWKITHNIDADYKTLYDLVLVEIIEMTQSRYGFYGFINEDESVMTIHSWSKEAMEICKISDKPIEFPIAKAGLWGEAVRKRKILIVNDYKGDHPGKKGTPEGHVSLTRILTVPVFNQGRIIALAAISNKPTDYTEEDAEQIEAFVTHLQVILERRQAKEALQESEHHLRLLSSELLTVQEAERKRIARDIHDSIGQTLAAIKFGLENKLSQMSGRTAPPGVSIENIISLTQNGIEESRRIQMDLRPSILDDLGILATIGWFTREFQKVYSHISVEKQISVEEDEIPISLKTALFRIMQEAMNNVAKHSKADLIRLTLRKAADKIELSVEDNGAGFDPETIKQGLGLTSMRERTELSGGTFTVESVPGKGTTIRASWTL